MLFTLYNLSNLTLIFQRMLLAREMHAIGNKVKCVCAIPL